MANLSRSFNLPRFLTRSKFALIAFLAILFVGSFTQADETQRWIPGVSGSTTDASVWENGTALPEGGTGYIYDGVQTITDTALSGNRTLEFTGGTTSFTSNVTISSGSGFTIKGGTLNTYQITSNGGTYDVSGGVWNNGTERITLNGNSTVNLSGSGVINFNGYYYLNGRDTQGFTVQSGDSILNLNSVWSSGSAGGWFQVGEKAEARGSSYTLQSGTINLNSGEFKVSHGTFTQSGGVFNMSNGSGIVLTDDTDSVFNFSGGTFNMKGAGFINAELGTFSVTGNAAINVTPTAFDSISGKKIVGIFKDEATAQNVLDHTTMADGWTAGVVTVNNQAMILAGQDSVPSGIKIWKPDTTGSMSDEVNWNGTTGDTTGYILSGTKNKITAFSGNLIINGGKTTINSPSTNTDPCISAGQILVYNGGDNTLGSDDLTSSGSIYINGGRVTTARNLRIIGTESNVSYLEVSGTLNVARYLAIAQGTSTKVTAKVVINNGIVYCGTSKSGGLIVADGTGTNGELVLNGGTLQVTNSLPSNIGNAENSTAKFTMTGGTFTTAGTINIGTGKNAKATVDISGGELTTTASIVIGTGSGAKGALTVSGGEVTAKRVAVGRKSAGDDAKLTITGGKLIITQDLCGSDSSASGCVYISNKGQIVFNSTYSNDIGGIREMTKFQIAGAGDGTGALRFLNSLQSKVQITLTDDATIGIEPGKTFTQSAAIAQTQESALTIMGGGTLALSTASSFTGGTTIDSSAVQLSGAGTLGSGAITLNDGTLILNGITSSIASNISGSGDISITSGTATLTGSVTQDGGNTTLADETTLSLSADSTLNNLGVSNENAKATLTAGNLTLNNDTTTKFIGSITADSINKTGNGTLQLCALTDDGEAIDAQSFVVNSGRLDMKDYFIGALKIGEELGAENYSIATFSPGNSIGTLNIDGSFTLNPGSTLLMEIGSTEAEGNDQLIINDGGSILFQDNSIIEFAPTSSFTPSLNEVIEVTMPDVDWENVTFSSYYFTLQGYDGTNVLLGVNPNAVPEPSTWALLILGAAGLMYMRKRKN